MSNIWRDRLKERFRQPENWKRSRFQTPDSRWLDGYKALPANPIAHVLYVAGTSEFTEKTYELARNFNAQSFGFWAFDRYGMGRSGRRLTNVFKQHAENFDYDVADICDFTDQKMPKDKPVFLLGHSTGGLLSTMALHERPNLFKGAVLTAPLFGIADKALKGREKIFNYITLPDFIAHRYIPGGTDWKLRAGRNGTTDSDYSSDSDRMKLQDYWQAKDFDLRTGSLTIGWVQAASRAITKVRDPDYLSRINRPIYIFTAGDEDMANKVDNAATQRVADLLPRSKFRNLAGARHEMLMEADPIRNCVLSEAMAFMRQYAI